MGVFVGRWVNTGISVFVAVGVLVMVGVSVASGLSVAGRGVKVGVAERNADVCIADQVWAAAVSGQPGTLDTACEPIPQAVEIKKARMTRIIRRRYCRSIIASTAINL